MLTSAPVSDSRRAAFLRTLDTSRGRLRLYALFVIGCFFIAAGLVLVRAVLKPRPIEFATGDGKEYYVYLPSLVIDHDLDFSNQMREHWGKMLQRGMLESRTELGYVRNKHPIGLALSLAPTFLLADGISWAAHALTGSRVLRPDGYNIIYQFMNLATVLLAAWGTMALVDWLGESHFHVQPRALAIGMLGVMSGSAITYCCLRAPMLVHIVSGFWVVAAIVFSARIAARIETRQLRSIDLLGLCFACSMAIVCRPSNAFLAVFLFWLLGRIIARGLFARFLACLPLALLGSFPILLQVMIWHRMTGHWVTFSYDPDERFYWTRPELLNTLVSPRCGLLVWSPIVILAGLGLIRQIATRRDALLVCYVISFLVLWYTNSAWWCWWFGKAFGARAFIEMSGLFMLGLAFFAQWALAGPVRARRIAFAAILAGVAINFVLMARFDLTVLKLPE